MSKKRTKDLHVNRKYKDSLFRMIFSDKKDLLELYNAVNGSHYDNPEDLTLYTLEDAIYISYKNDISFLFGDTLNLYEHQSTINPNMPLRGLLYLVRNYEAYIEQHHLDIYRSIQQTVPLPQYIIFYNGTAEVPEQQILSLSDAFPKHPGKVSCLQFDAILLNINYEKNQKILQHCQKLREYAVFIHTIRFHLKNGMTLENAVSTAITECIARHILEDFLIKHRGEVKSMVLSSFDQENHDRILKEAYEKIGIEKGEKSGIRKGELQKLIFQIKENLKQNIPTDTIAHFLCEDEKTIILIADAIKKHPEMDVPEIYNLLFHS